MLKAYPGLIRLLMVAPLTIAVTLPAFAQVKALRAADDQFIQGLREQGMSDLLERFSEADPPEDPIARLALDVSLKEFVASDLLARATQASQVQDYAQANQFFQDSRKTFEGVLDAQRTLIDEHPDDERMPLWQADFAEMLLDRYMPRYFQNVAWHYEFGQPSDEQKQAFESSMVESLKVTMDAAYKLELLPSRVNSDAKLKGKLEDMGIWYKLNDYRSINVPYWLATSAQGVMLLPDEHAYFAEGGKVRGQRATPADERKRLRDRVVDECSAAIGSDERTKLTAKLLSGKALIWSDKVPDIDDGVDILDEEVIKESPGSKHGYLATLAKAVGRWNGGELEIAETILGGMDKHEYVKNDQTTVSRLLAADLLFRILTTEAEKAPAAQQAKKIAEAYEKAYLSLIDNDDDPRFRQVLFTRWAENFDPEQDPASLPATVRMGIGEQLTKQGGGKAQAAVAFYMAGKPAIPAEAEQWSKQLKDQIAAARTLLERGVRFNTTLIGEDMEGPVLARGLFNLGTNKYWLAELQKVENEGKIGWQPYFEVAKIWLDVAKRVPDAPKAEEALTYAIGLVLPQDMFLNKESVTQPEVRAVYREAFELINQLWPQNAAAHNNRLYAAFHLNEKVGKLDDAVEVYRALPNTHRDYYQARRQMIYAMHRAYRGQSDKERLMRATQPLKNAPDGLNPEQLKKFEEGKILWQQQYDALVEDITRKRDDIIEESELVVIDAQDTAENGQTPALRFAAATALGASRVVLAGMEADTGNTDKAMDLLKGFEKEYDPKGKYADLAALQGDAGPATLQGLIQSAQEQRILTLLNAKRTGEMAKQAEVMMVNSPDVAAAVVNGVLTRIRAEIDREKRAIEEAAFDAQREQARENIRFLATAAVDLGDLLVKWARDQGFSEEKMVAYQMPLAESLMLAGKGEEALKIIDPILEKIPNNFNILIKAGKAHTAVYTKNKKREHYEKAMASFSKVITYYNQRLEKPAYFWEAWLGAFELMDASGGAQAQQIPKRARMLYGVDENLGGPSFKENFELIIQRNGGVERLQPQPGVITPKEGESDQSSWNDFCPWPETFASKSTSFEVSV